MSCGEHDRRRDVRVESWLRENVLDVMILLAICGGNR
jgi:hypothetical protein